MRRSGVSQPTSRKPSWGIRWETFSTQRAGSVLEPGARTLPEIGDPNRFANPGRLAAYAGPAPVDRQSGRSHRTRRSRGGNHRLKNAMFTAAFVAPQHDPDARAYYLRKRAEGKRHNAAVICVARRRCNIILAMLKTQTPYQPPRTENLPQAD